MESAAQLEEIHFRFVCCMKSEKFAFRFFFCSSPQVWIPLAFLPSFKAEAKISVCRKMDTAAHKYR